MRRISAALLVPLLAGLASWAAVPPPAPALTRMPRSACPATFDKTPGRKIPASKARRQAVRHHGDQGHRRGRPSGDNVLANVAIYKWSGKTHKLLDSTFTAFPAVVPAEIGLTGLASAIKGQKMGSRVLAVLPPKYGYGTAGNSNLGVAKTDTTVWVIDLIKPFTPTASATGATVSRAAAPCRRSSGGGGLGAGDHGPEGRHAAQGPDGRR